MLRRAHPPAVHKTRKHREKAGFRVAPDAPGPGPNPETSGIPKKIRIFGVYELVSVDTICGDERKPPPTRKPPR